MFRSKSQPDDKEIEMTQPTATPAKLNPAMVSRLNEVARHAKDIQKYGDAGAKIDNRVTVGPGIRLKGEITDCDTLVVEGHVELSAKPRFMEITETGTVIGDIDVKTADVSGRFDGTLNVNERLTVRSTGVVSGKIRYNTIEIEPGGRISGNVETEEAAEDSAPVVEKDSSPVVKKDSSPAVKKDSSPVVEDASKRAEQRWATGQHGDPALDKLKKLSGDQKNGELGGGADQSR